MTDDRRIAFGDRLRQLRKAARFTGKEFARRADWQASKISRLESGQQIISERDLATWCELLELPESEASRLRTELKGIRLDESRWKQRLRGGHQVVQESFGAAERDAKHIRNVETGLVPGLVQTPEYAHAVFSSLALLKGTPDDAEAAVRERLRRQEVLYDPTKRVELIVTESALRTPIASSDVMAGQLDRLLALPGVPSVRFGVIPLGTKLPFPLLHGFALLDDTLIVEAFNTEMTSRDTEDVELYGRLHDACWEVALEGPDVRALLLRTMDETYRTT